MRGAFLRRLLFNEYLNLRLVGVTDEGNYEGLFLLLKAKINKAFTLKVWCVLRGNGLKTYAVVSVIMLVLPFLASSAKSLSTKNNA